MLAGLDGELLGRQPKRVESHGVQYVVARHPLEPTKHVGTDEAERMSNVEARARWVRKHVEDEQLLAPFGGLVRIGERPGRVRCLKRGVLVPPILPAAFDLLSERHRVSEWRNVSRFGVSLLVHTDHPAYEAWRHVATYRTSAPSRSYVVAARESLVSRIAP